MAIGPTLGLSNLLISRVMRHRNIATLFRAASPVARPRSPAGSSEIPGIVTAIPVAYVPDDSWSVPGVATGQPRWLTPPEASSGIALRPARPTPGRAAPRTMVMQRPEAAVSEPTPIGEQAPEEAPSGTSITDDVWHRLKTIFQRHQETLPETQDSAGAEADQDTESHAAPEQMSGPTLSGATSPESGSDVPPTRSRSADGAPVRRMESIEGQPAGEAQRSPTRQPVARQERPPRSAPSDPDTPATLLGQDGSEAPEPLVAPELADIAGSAASPDAVPTAAPRAASPELTVLTASVTGDTRPSEPQAAGQASAVAPAEPPAIPTGSSRPDQPLRPTAPREARQVQSGARVRPVEPEAGQPVQSGAGVVEFAGSVSAQVPGTPPSPSDVTAFASLTPSEETSRSALLQSVWSVQRVVPPVPAKPPVPGDAIRPAVEARSVPVIRGTRTLPMSIAQVLEKVSAGGPTQSGIEVIAPSRPRPVVLRHRESARASRTREARTSQDDASTVTRVSATTPETDPTDDLIQTQIGALPRDLWQLIGERVPEQRVSNDQELEPAGDATTEPEPGATALTRGRHASPPVASLLQPPSGRPSTSGAPAIQRTTVAQQAQAPSASTAQDPATASPAQTESTEQQQSPTEVAFEGESGAEVDIGELARRVYAEIKRRLSVERERFRSF